MAYTYPQVFSLERPPFTFALKYMPDTDLCNGGGNSGTGQTPPCTDCPEKMPFAPQDVFDLQWPVPITSAVIRLPNGTIASNDGILNFEGNKLRIAFCNAPPCFTVEINNECTLLGFERIECFVDCETQPSAEPPTPLPPVLPIAQASFVQFEHVRMTDNVAFSTNIIGLSDAVYSYTRYPNTPVSFTASSLNGLGGAVADHLHETVTGAVVNASIIQGVEHFFGWVFDVPPVLALGYTSSGTYAPAPLPPQFISGNATTPTITFVVPAGTHLRARALFDPNRLANVLPDASRYAIHALFYEVYDGEFSTIANSIYGVDVGDVYLAPRIPTGWALVCEIEFNTIVDRPTVIYPSVLFFNDPPLGNPRSYHFADYFIDGFIQLLVRFKYTIVSGNLYASLDFINRATNTVIDSFGYNLVGDISADGAYFNQLLISDVDISVFNYNVRPLYFEEVNPLTIP